MESIQKEGYISKRSRYLQQWRRRWCTVTATYFSTYEDNTKSKNPTEQILIKNIKSVKSAEDETNKENSFKVELVNQTFYFQADNLDDKEKWIGIITKLMIDDNRLEQNNINNYDNDDFDEED